MSAPDALNDIVVTDQAADILAEWMKGYLFREDGETQDRVEVMAVGSTSTAAGGYKRHLTLEYRNTETLEYHTFEVSITVKEEA